MPDLLCKIRQSLFCKEKKRKIRKEKERKGKNRKGKKKKEKERKKREGKERLTDEIQKCVKIVCLFIEGISGSNDEMLWDGMGWDERWDGMG